ncbi:MAG: pilus assembly protein N-terminal domain-containing protein, partial [Capnocytophaga sp.]|nr:pilus assembly protein N-terminal domain-containing protein [Capnocytophaga sp.]
MKKINIIIALFLCVAITAISCIKDDEQTQTALNVSKEAVNFSAGTTQSIIVAGANGEISATSADESIAKVSVKGDEVIIEAQKEGKTTVTITDSQGNTKTIPVEILKSLLVSSENVIFRKGEEKIVEILSGEGEYSLVNENEKVATAVLSGNSIKLTAVADGTTNVYVSDKKSNATKQINVIVSELVVDKAEVFVEVGKEASVSITGSGKYSVTSQNEMVASATLDTKNNIIITGNSAGETTVLLADAGTKAQVPIQVKVSLLSLSLKSVALAVGKTAELTITGSGNYEALSISDKVATAIVEGDILKVTAVALGKTTIELTDLKTTQKLALPVEVTEKVSFNESEVTILEEKQLKVAIVSGSGQYAVTSSDEAIATATTEANSLIIKAIKSGKTTLTLTDSKTNETATLAVVVVPKIAVEKESVSLVNSQKITVKITQGSGSYSVKTSNDKVAQAKVSDNSVEITGVSVGTAKITVTDAKTKTEVVISVEVTGKITLAKSEIFLPIGKEESLAITDGSGTYSVSNNNTEVVTASVEGTNLKLIAKKAGEASLTLTDIKTQETTSLKVIVVAPLALEKETLMLLESHSQEVKITQGSGYYTATSEKAHIVSASIVDNNKVKVESVYGQDQVKITVTDTKTGLTKTLTVTVQSAFTISPSEVSLQIGQETTVNLNGSGNYAISGGSTTIATVTQSGNKLTVRGVAGGSTTFDIKDNQQNVTKKLKVTVSNSELTLDKPSYTMEFMNPEDIYIKDDKTRDYPYTVKSDNEEIFTAEEKFYDGLGNHIVIKPTGVGTANLTVTNTETNRSVTVPVTINAPALIFNPTNITVQEEKSAEVRITSGTGDYILESSDDNIATAEYDETTKKIIIEGISAGTTRIKVYDFTAEKEQYINVTVTTKPAIGSAVVIEGGVAKSLNCDAITGGELEITGVTSIANNFNYSLDDGNAKCDNFTKLTIDCTIIGSS